MIASDKDFTNGNSQAIRLPKAFRLDAEEVRISKGQDGIITTQPKPKKDELEAFMTELRGFAPSRIVFAAPR